MQNQPGTFRTAEQSDETKPLYIYIFKHTTFAGASNSYFLTNYDKDVTVNGLPVSKGANPQSFLSAQIAHGEIEQQAEQNAPGTSISVGLNGSAEANELKTYFLTPNASKIDVTIARVNASALPNAVTWGTDTYTVFRGVKNGVSIEGQLLTMSCMNQMLQEDGMIPRFYYQKTCQHDLGSIGPGLCNAVVDQTNRRITGNISGLNRFNRTVDMATLLFDDGSTASPDKFIGGKLFILNAGNPVNVITISAAQVFAGTATAVVACATTGNLNMGIIGLPVASPVFNIDGIGVVAGATRVLIKNSTDPRLNGIYVLQFLGTTMTGLGQYQFYRESDPLAGAIVSVTGGTVNHGTIWTQTTAAPILGTSNIVFASGAASNLRFRLSWWDSSLAIAMPVKILRGCLHIVASCAEFGNVPNFGGTPFVPVSNPSTDGVNT
jgi:hypothetical protein